MKSYQSYVIPLLVTLLLCAAHSSPLSAMQGKQPSIVKQSFGSSKTATCKVEGLACHASSLHSAPLPAERSNLLKIKGGFNAMFMPKLSLPVSKFLMQVIHLGM